MKSPQPGAAFPVSCKLEMSEEDRPETITQAVVHTRICPWGKGRGVGPEERDQGRWRQVAESDINLLKPLLRLPAEWGTRSKSLRWALRPLTIVPHLLRSCLTSPLRVSDALDSFLSQEFSTSLSFRSEHFCAFSTSLSPAHASGFSFIEESFPVSLYCLPSPLCSLALISWALYTGDNYAFIFLELCVPVAQPVTMRLFSTRNVACLNWDML